MVDEFQYRGVDDEIKNKRDTMISFANWTSIKVGLGNGRGDLSIKSIFNLNLSFKSIFKSLPQVSL